MEWILDGVVVYIVVFDCGEFYVELLEWIIFDLVEIVGDWCFKEV